MPSTRPKTALVRPGLRDLHHDRCAVGRQQLLVPGFVARIRREANTKRHDAEDEPDAVAARTRGPPRPRPSRPGRVHPRRRSASSRSSRQHRRRSAGQSSKCRSSSRCRSVVNAGQSAHPCSPGGTLGATGGVPCVVVVLTSRSSRPVPPPSCSPAAATARPSRPRRPRARGGTAVGRHGRLPDHRRRADRGRPGAGRDPGRSSDLER